VQPAPLLTSPGAPIRGEVMFIRAGDGARLRVALCPSRGAARGSVILSPGRSEPLEKYAEVIAELQGRDLNVLVHDWRGQGLSDRFAHAEGGLGHARGWRPFVADLAAVTSAFAGELPRPWTALGHSMGGGLTLLAMAEGAVAFDAAVLSAAMLGVRLGSRSPRLVRSVAALMVLAGRGGRLSPRANPGPPLEEQGQVLTHDADRWDAYLAVLAAHPELKIGLPTWGWLYFALALSRRLEAVSDLSRISAPVTLIAAEHDRLVPNAPQQDAARRLPHGRYVEIEGAFHEVLMETDARRAQVWRAFDQTVAALG
jgi:lysophospholipase